MQELLGAIGERRARLASEVPVAHEEGPTLEDQLNKLETDVCYIHIYSICESQWNLGILIILFLHTLYLFFT